MSLSLSKSDLYVDSATELQKLQRNIRCSNSLRWRTHGGGVRSTITPRKGMVLDSPLALICRQRNIPTSLLSRGFRLSNTLTLFLVRRPRKTPGPLRIPLLQIVLLRNLIRVLGERLRHRLWLQHPAFEKALLALKLLTRLLLRHRFRPQASSCTKEPSGKEGKIRVVTPVGSAKSRYVFFSSNSYTTMTRLQKTSC